MTLIALSINYGHPIMMADILITSKEGTGIEIPTFSQRTEKILKPIDNRMPIDLRQKLYIINDNLCVAIGGDGCSMDSFLNRMNNLFGDNDYKHDQLHDYLINYEKDYGKGLISLILAANKHSDGRTLFTTYFIGKVKECDSDIFQKIFASGSGVDQFLDHAKSKMKHQTNGLFDNEVAIINNLTLLGYWFGLETQTAESISNHWGAGYEMIHYINNKFVKLDEYTVVLLTGQIENSKEFNTTPFNTMVFNYQDENLIIKSFKSGQLKHFVVASILNRESELSILPKNESHKNLLITYVIHNKDNGKYYFPSVAKINNGNKLPESPILIHKTTDNLQLTISNKLNSYIYDMIIETLKVDSNF